MTRPLPHRANYKNHDAASLVDRQRQPPRQASRRISLATSQYETLFNAIQDVGRTRRSDCAHCRFPWTCSCDGQGPGCMPILMIRFEPATKQVSRANCPRWVGTRGTRTTATLMLSSFSRPLKPLWIAVFVTPAMATSTVRFHGLQSDCHPLINYNS